MSNSKKRVYAEIKKDKSNINENNTASIKNKGVVSAITMGGKTFDVLNPNVLQEIQQTFNNMESDIIRLKEKDQKILSTINSLVNEVNRMSAELRSINDSIRNSRI